MSALREFAGLGSFARFLDERAAEMTVGKAAIGEAAAHVLRKAVRRGYGSHALASLAPATQADRIKKGYTPNDPLLRDGSLLRDSTEMLVGEDFAGVGSAQPIAAYHEHGYMNVRAGHSVPPRPVYKNALEEAAPAIVKIIEENIGFDLGLVSVERLGAEDAADYALTVAKQ